MKPPYSLAPALPAAAGMAVGIALACWSSIAAIAIAAAGLLAFALLYFKAWHYPSFFALMLALGSLLAIAHKPAEIAPEYCNGEVLAVATITAVEHKPQSLQCVARIEEIDSNKIAPVKYLIRANEDERLLQLGAKVSIKLIISPVHDAPGVPHEIDYQRYLRYQGITCTAFPLPGSVTEISAPGSLARLITKTRNGMLNAIVDAPINGPTAAFLAAVLVGDDVFISPTTSQAFRASGLSHMLALSGLHVGIIASMIGVLLLPLNLVRGAFSARVAISMALIWVYAILVGLSPSVTRAAVMLTAYLFARLVQRGSYPFNSLCLAAVVILAFNPYSLFTPGFQMTFAAVASILLFMRLLPDSLRRRRCLFFFLSVFLLPIAAMLGTGIVAAYYYHALPLLFLPVNMAAGIIFPWLLGSGVALMLATLAGARLYALGKIADGLCLAIEKLAQWAAGCEFAQAQGMYFTAWAIVPYAVAVLLLGLGLRQILDDKKPRPSLWLGCAGCLAAFVLCLFAFPERVPEAEMYLPAGSPAGIIIRSGHEAYAMPLAATDAGDDFIRAYNHRFADFLQSRKCGESFLPMPDSLSAGPFVKKGNLLIAGDKLLCLANADNLLLPRRCSALLITKGFAGDADKLLSACQPDSLLICNGVNGRRAKKILEDCKKSIPARNLRGSTYAIVW